jgi:hypothetical protein
MLAYLSSSPSFLRPRMVSCLQIILQGHPTVGRYTTISTAGSCTDVGMHIFGPIQVGFFACRHCTPLSCFPTYICRRVSVHSCNVCMLECHAASVAISSTSDSVLHCLTATALMISSAQPRSSLNNWSGAHGRCGLRTVVHWDCFRAYPSCQTTSRPNSSCNSPMLLPAQPARPFPPVSRVPLIRWFCDVASARCSR